MYYFIVNPGSRSGRGKAVWQIVEGILEREQVEYLVFFTAYRYHATKLAREITSQKEKLTLVTVGGDGTVNEVVDGIQDFSRVTFGYIPTGSSNDFARSLRLPRRRRRLFTTSCIPPIFKGLIWGLSPTAPGQGGLREAAAAALMLPSVRKPSGPRSKTH